MQRIQRYVRQLTAGILCAAMLAGCGGTAEAEAPGDNTATGQTAEDQALPEEGTAAEEEAVKKPPLMEEDEEEMTVSRALMKANQVQQEGDARIFPEGEDFIREKKGYTVLVYMIGSDLEGSYGYATRDMKEMEASGIDLDANNLLIYTGGSRMWKSDVPSGRNNVLDMSLPAGERVVAATKGPSDMGAPETLSEFLNYGVQRYPAEHYALIFWDHGGGSVYGYGNDVLYSGDSLLLTEMQTAMNDSPFGSGGSLKLDWVGFDACLMSTAENADVWKKYTNYMIASEETEPGDGWSYTFLKDISAAASPEAIGKSIVDAYISYYREKRTPLNDPDITLAVLNLKKMDNLVGAIDSLSLKMQRNVGDERFAELVRTRSATKTFGVRGSRSEGYDLLDIRDLAANMTDWYPAESARVEAALKEVLVYGTKEVPGACGLSLYFPGENRTLYEAVQEEGTKDMYVSDTFRSFAETYTEKWLTASDLDWTVADFVDAGDELTLQLTEDQAANLDNASYTVLLSSGDGYYRRGICRVTIKPDENNVLHIPKDPQLIVAVTDQDGVMDACAFVQTDIREGEKSYESQRMFFCIGEDMLSDSADYVIASVEDEGDGLAVKGFRYNDNAVGTAGKNSVDLTDYTTLNEYTGSRLYPTYDSDGKMLPYYRWETQQGVMSAFVMSLDESLHFEYRRASEVEEKSIVQVLLKDINGDDHSSGIHELSNGASAEKDERTVATEKGTLTFEIRDGEAVLTGYEGEDKVLNVPAEVEGIPVTCIGKTSISSSGLREVTIPEGVRKLERKAFYFCYDLQKITLPGSVEVVGDNIIYQCIALKEVILTGDSSAISVKDGVLFDADGKTLIKYPNGKGRFYEVPEGTETIGYGAFMGADLVEIVFPETLKAIGNYAFENCDKLRALDLPASLERIGAGAFGVDHTFEIGSDEEEEPVLGTVTFGPNLRSVGKEAFRQRKVVSFAVDPGNETFSAVNGMLASRAGDVLILCPMEIGGSVVVPEGVVGISSGIFADLPSDSTFVLPDSLTRITVDSFPAGRDENFNSVYELLIYCTKGSAAETFAAKNKLPYELVEEGSPALDAYTLATLPGLNGTYTFRLYQDHAAFIRYKGSDAFISVPASVQGLPVTEVGDGSSAVDGTYTSSLDVFHYEDNTPETDNLGQYPQGYVRGIELPDCVEVINAYALSEYSLDMDTFVLPAGLRELSPVAFGGKRSSGMDVGSFSISEDNDHFKTVDGVLFSKDGSRLIRFPTCPKTDMPGLTMERVDGEPVYTYSVPDGVEEIGQAAFANVEMERVDNGVVVYDFKVDLPASVETISDYAFYSAYIFDVGMQEGIETIGAGAFSRLRYNNTTLTIPSTVEEIGDEGFAYMFREDPETGKLVYGFTAIELPEDLKKLGAKVFASSSDSHLVCSGLTLGRKLDKVDEGAFYDSYVQAFTVAEGNDRFTAVDGCLLTEDGTVLFAVPNAMEGEMTVPAGVTEIGRYAFYDCDGITDVHISPEVTRISPQAFFVGYGKPTPVIHGQAGSEAERFALSVGMEWKEE